MNKRSNSFYLSIFERSIKVIAVSEKLSSLLQKIYGSMLSTECTKKPDLEYTISDSQAVSPMFTISRTGSNDLTTNDIGEFIFLFEKDMTIELQKLRSDLLFIHSAALEFEGKGLLLVAPSGTGKSTTAWAMINTGFNYLSDELAPIDIANMSIHPYHHALCLKSKPPLFELPDNTLFTSQTIHVPCDVFNTAQLTSLNAIFFLEFVPTLKETEILPVTTAEAAGNLYTNSLNILAHDSNDDGLNVAITVSKHVKSYKLRSNDLEKTCTAVQLIMQAIH